MLLLQISLFGMRAFFSLVLIEIKIESAAF